MFKSLRRKFVSSSMMVVAVVVLLVAGALNYINYSKMVQRTDDYLIDFSKNQELVTLLTDEEDTTVIINTKNTDKVGYSGFSAARVDENNNFKKYFNDDLNLRNKDIEPIVKEVLAKNTTSGYIESHRYLKTTFNENQTMVLFYNSVKDLDNYHTFLESSIIVSVIVILSILILLILVSKRVISPLQQSYIKQKQFITDASHELKTPLTIIRSNTDVLELEHGASKWTSNIQNQVDRLTSLVNSLVVFSRMEEKESVEKTKFSLTKVLNNRIDDFSELASFQGKNINANVDENINYLGEEQTITQLIDILLDNAIKYAPKNSDINIYLTKNTRKHATLTVSNKANVKEGQLDKVFDRFYRLDESRNSSIKGYGIGLSLAKLIADKHKESIRAYSPKDGIFEISMKFTLPNEQLVE